MIDSEERFRLLVESVEDYAIFLLDRDGIVRSWNAGAEKIKGYTASEIIGRPFTQFYPQSANDAGWPQEELRRARLFGRFEDEGWRVRKDGTRFWANVIITALRNEAGETYGFAKVTRDLSERRRHEEALHQSEERFRLLVEGVRDYALFMLDPDGRIVSWNSGAAAIKGYHTAEVLGQQVSIFYTAEDQAEGRPAHELRRALREGRAEFETWCVRKDGSVFWANMTITPVFDAGGNLRGYAQVTRDMSEHQRLSELESSTRRMSEFLAMLAHELRNPLAPIRNAVGIMQLERALSPRLQNCRDIIDRQLSHLTRLVDDLLDVGRITTGKISLKRERVTLREVALRSIEATKPLIEQHRHVLKTDLPDDPLELEGDGTRLVQILQNLLTNAAKYTPDGGTIELSIKRDGPFAVATVTDNGQGIEPEALERVFELFVQENGSTLSSESGLGIGLTLARTLAELHGGTLRAESAGRGQGSRFTLRLPLRVESRLAPPAAIDERTPELNPACVLVVDDNRDSADSMAGLLRLLGHDAKVAYDGDMALKLAAAIHPEVVLLDLNMPHVDGFDVMKRLKALPRRAPHGVIAAMTGYGQEADRLKTLEAGFDAHLTKPVGVEQLQSLIASARQPAR